MGEHENEHAQGETEGPESPGGLNVTAIAVVGIISVLLVVVTAISLQAWYYSYQEDLRRQGPWRQRPAQLERYNQQQREVLHGAEWLDEDRETARIPIDAAMEIVAERGLESDG